MSAPTHQSAGSRPPPASAPRPHADQSSVAGNPGSSSPIVPATPATVFTNPGTRRAGRTEQRRRRQRDHRRVPTRFVRKYTLRAKASALDPDVLLDRPRRRRWPLARSVEDGHDLTQRPGRAARSSLNRGSARSSTPSTASRRRPTSCVARRRSGRPSSPFRSVSAPPSAAAGACSPARPTSGISSYGLCGRTAPKTLIFACTAINRRASLSCPQM